jgi:hypothetical protein
MRPPRSSYRPQAPVWTAGTFATGLARGYAVDPAADEASVTALTNLAPLSADQARTRAALVTGAIRHSRRRFTPSLFAMHEPEESLMPKIPSFLTVLAGVLGLSVLAAPAHAQLARTFVSSLGNDANDCNRTTPCRTFQRAHDNTLANGEITVLDPGGYGAVNITKTISIINDGVGEAGMLISGGVTGVTINAAPTDTVSLRGLTIKGIGFGSGNGIVFNTGKFLTVENCAIRNLARESANAGTGITFSTAGSNVASQLAISNTLIADSFIGINIAPVGSGVLKTSLSRVELYDNEFGLNVAPSTTSVSARVSVTDSVVDGSTAVGINVSAPAGSSALTSVMVVRSSISNNSSALAAAGSGFPQLRIGQSIVAGNLFAWQTAHGGVFQSYGDNYIAGNDNQLTPPTIARE